MNEVHLEEIVDQCIDEMKGTLVYTGRVDNYLSVTNVIDKLYLQDDSKKKYRIAIWEVEDE